MKNLVFILLILTSCIPNRQTSYRVINRNGKVVYFENKKTPLYNQNIDNIKVEELSKITNKAKQTSKGTITQHNNIDNNLVLDSSAYTLQSVVDTIVKDDDIATLAKIINKNKQVKTIKDFDNIPESYFNSNIPTEEDLKKNKQIMEDNKKKNSLFSKIKRFFKKENPEDDFIKYELANDTTKTKKNNTSSLTVKDDNITVKNGKTYYKPSTKATSTTQKTTNSSSTTTKTYVKPSQSTKQITNTGKYYIQLGSFKNKENANKLIDKFDNVGDEQKLIPTNTKNGLMYKAVIGNFNTKEEAEKEMEKVLNKGHFDCYVVKI